MTHLVSPKKYLGQNFLVDPHVNKRLIEACAFLRDDIVLEIGPGLGALTKEISKRVKKIIAVETDKSLYKHLSGEMSGENVELVCQDFLKFDLTGLPKGIKVFGNLPYNISSPIIARILENREHFTSLFITVQHEFGKRLVAVPGTKDYSAFSCFVQYYSKPKLFFRIKNTAFRPIPKVQSCFLELKIFQDLPIKAKNEKLLFQVIRQAFGQRRKQILNSLESAAPKKKLLNIFNKMQISATLRAENLALKDFIAIADALEELDL